MAVSRESFLPRKRRPAAASFICPKLSGIGLLQALHSLSLDVCALGSLRLFLKRSSASVVRKCELLAVLLEEILRSQVESLFPSKRLCFEEMYIVLQRMKTLMEDCLKGSMLWLLMQIETIAYNFHELTVDLWTLLEVLDLKLNDEVEELQALIIKQCGKDTALTDPVDVSLRIEVLNMLDSIEREIVPDHSGLAEIFTKLGLSDSASCKEEIECLEDEVQSQTDKKSKSDSISLIGLVRYAKCRPLRAEFSPPSDEGFRETAPELATPADFRCPITLDLMTDPVVVATGQTYDRSSIVLWLESGHNTCPKSGQTLAHTNLIPNRALKNLIGMWCREQRIPYAAAEANRGVDGVISNKTALEATKMTVSFLINKLAASSRSGETANGVIYELRIMAKMDSDSRAYVGEGGAIPLLVPHLSSDDPSLQVNAVTTMLNLSILDANKKRIMETDGALSGVIGALRSGATWEAKGNAAATILSLSGMHSYRKKLGKKTRVIRGLLDLAKEGPAGAKKDAMVAILAFAGERETVGRLIEEGVVAMVEEVVDELPEEAVAILEVVVKKGGVAAVAAASHVVGKLATIVRFGGSRARESAVATLVIICRRGGTEMVAELARTSAIEVIIWDLMGTGTARAKRKAASLMRILHRWAAGLEGDVEEGNSMATELLP
ncbi:hypothetical protein Nepgr_030544 [Nepenthes gracilis]|uniref:RING-type E3 ubiquitin transferase n=1 Tax=Nepenthes gracilis TaxID=150966 RepID=A0AAD3TGU9_NEPGR|nr:hypothetical protein Nepgr_030544 [Nepenthes gracilis]